MGIRIWDKLMLGSGSKMPRIEPTLTGAAAMRPYLPKTASNTRSNMQTQASLLLDRTGIREKLDRIAGELGSVAILYESDYEEDISKIERALSILGYIVEKKYSNREYRLEVRW